MAIQMKSADLQALETRLKAILPEMYQECYEDVQPVSMGSAGLKYDAAGRVAWDEIWGSFCHLAMAGGPPHKGKLLRPGTRAEIEAQPEQYAEVVAEICRGITSVTVLPAEKAEAPGWVRVQCDDAAMAEWLVRAIVMENVSAHWEDSSLYLPAGPAFRLEKEIKNVITAMAKTCHYWVDHMWLSQIREIRTLFARLADETVLLQAPFPNASLQISEPDYWALAEGITSRTGMQCHAMRDDSWLGIECKSVSVAIWLMRALVVSNVLSRREETILFVPINPELDPGGVRLGAIIGKVCELAREHGIL